MKNQFILFLGLMVAALGHATTYHVSNSGNDNFAGSIAAPWLTIQHGVDQISPGDTLYVNAGFYPEKIHFNQSGMANAPLTIMGDPSNFPLVDGSTLSPNGREGLITISNHAFIQIVQIELANFSSNTDDTPVGFYVEGQSHDLILRNCRIHHIRQTSTTGFRGANGIGVYGTSHLGAIYNLTLEGNEVYDCETFWSEVVTLNGNVRDFTVLNNEIHDCNNIGLDFIGWEEECWGCTATSGNNVDRARSGMVKGNVIWNIDTKDNLAYEGERNAAAYYVDGGADIVFEGNTAYNSNFGLELASEHFGKATENITVRSNLIYNNHILGIATGGYDVGTGEGGGSAKDCFVVNNTLYNNHTSTRTEDDFGAEIYLQNRNENLLFQHNIVYAAPNRARVLVDGSLNSNNSFVSNLYHGSTVGTTPGLVSSAAPLFVAPQSGNFELQGASPAIDLGLTLTTSIVGTTDFNGNNRVQGNAIDLGAFETEDLAMNRPPREELAPVEVLLYPNPTSHISHLKLDQSFDLQRLQLTDVAGRPVGFSYAEEATGQWGLDLGPLPAGVYFLKLQGKGQGRVLRLVKTN